MDAYACRAVVIGAGVIGLAVGQRLASLLEDVWLVEATPHIGSGISSRNSEVIHAGIYYPSGSLKAATCVRGRVLLHDFCVRHGVPFDRRGKLIVATAEEQIPVLDGLLRQGLANGAGPLQWLDRAQVSALEPAVRAVAALLSPETGVIDSHRYLLSLRDALLANGGQLVLATPVERAEPGGDGHRLYLGGREPCCIDTPLVVNCAGLDATGLLRRFAAYPDALHRVTHLAKGSYFAYQGRVPFSRLIYPVPEPGGLGVHLTLDLAGQAKFGPDVEWIDSLDYTVDAVKAGRFAAAISRYWPGLDPSRLHPSYAGVRPKLGPPGAPAIDFLIEGPCEHGVPGLFNFLGIESPGLTASLALADLLVDQLADLAIL